MARDTLVESGTLTAIANAIRAKDGSTAQMYPSEMAGKIRAISTGIPVDNPVTAGDIPVLSSDVASATIKNSSLTASGVFINISKAGTYRFKYNMSKNYVGATCYTMLYKNGAQIKNTQCGQVSTGKTFSYTGDINCASRDRIEIYGKVGKTSDSDNIYPTVTTLTACVNLDLSYFKN